MLALLSSTVSSAQYVSKVWSPDNGDGTYTNPVLNADYSDPDVCAVGEDYYLTASSFAHTPGLPVLHSRDLVNWEIIGHALQSLFPESPVPQHGNGVWAPSIRHHNGEFYIYWGDPDRGIFMVKTKDPSSTWDEPVCVVPGYGMIDATPLWDDDGRCYLVNAWANSRCGFNSVLTVRELSADGTKAISNPVIVFDGGNENHTTEGPKFYKRDGWYWIMCPAGGVEKGWQLAMRSKSPYGPYEAKTVMAQGSTDINGPHQGGWVHTPYGEDWFLHFQDKGAYGRVVWLQPVDWSSGWPVMGRKGEPLTTYRKPKSSSNTIVNPQESDEFNSTRLSLQWQWQGDYTQYYGMPTANGVFRLFTYRHDATRNLWTIPSMLLQKTPADDFCATAKVRLAAKAEHQYGGVIMMGRSYGNLVVERVGDMFQLQQRICNHADTDGKETVKVIATLKPTGRDKLDYHPALYLDIYLRINVSAGKATFAYSRDGKKFTDAGDTFTMREGKWVGAKVGMLAIDNNKKSDIGLFDIDWFRIDRLKR